MKTLAHKPMRISFCWDWEPSYYQSLTWQDGLSAALKELGNRGHTLQILAAGKERNIIKNPHFDIQVSDDIPADVKEFNPDVILHWADLSRPNARATAKLGKPMALCFAGGDTMGETLPYFAHLFVESEVYKKTFEEYGRSVSIAFGTNTDLFSPLPGQPKQFDVIFPATFARWKRHELFAQAVRGMRALACGYIYTTHEQECWQVCLDNGVTILPHVSAETLRYLYAASRMCIIPSLSSGGSQRTVLEAMAMNLPLIVTDSDKFDYVDGQDVVRAKPTITALEQAAAETWDKEVNTRDYILEKWSHICYADALEAGLEKLL